MKTSKNRLAQILSSLKSKAQVLGLTDIAWSARAGIRHETLSRLRGRSSCDFQTLQALAEAVDSNIGLVECDEAPIGDDRFPESMDRAYEERLLELCASRDLQVDRWRRLGPCFFMAGLAVMLASSSELDRRSMLDLAEALHPGSSEVDVFTAWLERTPVRPSRFLPMLAVRMRRAA